MKNKNIYRVIIQADLQAEISVDILILRLRRWPDADMVHRLQGGAKLLILAATRSEREADDLIGRLNQLKEIAAVHAHFLFSRVQTFLPWPPEGNDDIKGGGEIGTPGFLGPVVNF